MKRVLCFVLLLVCFAFPALAESPIPADEDDITVMLEQALAQSDFDYSCVILNRKNGMFVVDVAIDGMTENALALKAAGFDETFEAWAGIRGAIQSMHASMLEMFSIVHRDDLKLILNLVNDDAYIREDYSTIKYNPLLSVGIFGTVDIDVLSESY